MQERLNEFLSRIPNLESRLSTELIDYFIYFLTEIEKQTVARPAEVTECFVLARWSPPGITQYLSRKSQRGAGKKPIFLRKDNGYYLERSRKEALDSELGVEPIKRQTSKTLSELVGKLTISSEQDYLREAVVCYEVGAYRAAVVMGWALAVDHLYEYVLAHKLTEFNAALANETNKRVKVSKITSKDDFNDIPDSNFIEICRRAKIITNDVRKILDDKLGTRNSSAHPSGIKITEVKASEVLQDLVENVISKYQL